MKTIRNVGDLARLVRQNRKAHGMTQEALAELAGTGRRFVVELESGKKETLRLGPTLRILNRLGIKIFFDDSLNFEKNK